MTIFPQDFFSARPFLPDSQNTTILKLLLKLWDSPAVKYTLKINKKFQRIVSQKQTTVQVRQKNIQTK